jgi:hypothetical protein
MIATGTMWGIGRMLKLSNTLLILSLAEKVMMMREHSAEMRIVLPRAAVEVPATTEAVSRAYALLAV